MLDTHAVLRHALRLAPVTAQAQLLALAINQLLRGQVIAERLGELTGKRIALRVDDVPLAFTFELRAGGLRHSVQAPHVTIRGALVDFVDLARRRVDPDALFFQRRLGVEGETETGLHLKNLLDGWDYDLPAHVRAVLPGPLASLTVHALSRLHPAGNRRNSHPAARRPGTALPRR
ncbi:MAG: SCP2 sterol-binding domain-containing protein [Pseudomonadales bacterium]|nr:SCP2 sterol-binding domain-containing protein [Pseudomonadales bacterium]